MTLNVSPQLEARLFEFAKQEGIDPAALIEKMISAYHPVEHAPLGMYTADNDPLVARLDKSIAAAPTDPKAILEAEEDLNELMQNMNANRAATRERIPFPRIK